MALHEKRVLIMAGGTGGHIIPALTVAKSLLEQNAKVRWLGTAAGLENKLVDKTQIPMSFISIQGIRSSGIKRKITAIPNLLRAVFQAQRIIREFNPDIVMGFGGFVSGPGAIAAVLAGKPLFLHEQNAIPGFTNRYLSRFATGLFQAFPNTFAKSALTVGNPVRREILQLPAPQLRRIGEDESLRVLVLGGSQGAACLNEVVPDAIAKISQHRPVVWHIAGEGKVQATQQRYRQLGVDARIDSFISDMASTYSWADIVICRAGALTVTELAAVGVASVLIPFPYAVDDHQRKNAEFLSKNGAAVLVPQAQLTVTDLANLLQDFTLHRDRLRTMAQSAYSLRYPNATEEIINHALAKITA